MNDTPSIHERQTMPEFLESIATSLDDIAQAILDHGTDTIWMEGTETAYDACTRLRQEIRKRVYIIRDAGPRDALHNP